MPEPDRPDEGLEPGAAQFDARDLEGADVYKAGDFAGRLERRSGGEVAFTYDPAYLASDGRPVASTLAKQVEPFVATGGAVPPFFAGLLPEGLRLRALVTHVKTSPDDLLSLLAVVGADTVGDVQVVPPGSTPSPPAPLVRTRSFASLRFGDLLAASIDPDHPDGVALPGVQEKVSAGTIAIPTATTSARYIVKLNPPRYPHLVENEAYFLAAARSAGLRTTTARLVRDAAGDLGLVVTRFDRVVTPGSVELVEQEDACQLLGLYPADKYLVTTEALFEAVAIGSSAPLPTLRDLLRLFVFSYVIGNGDLHAKNVSLQRDPSSRLVVPTPAYDLLSTSPYCDHDMALRVGGRRSGLVRERWLELSDGVGLPRRAAVAVLDAVVASVADWLDRLPDIGFDERRTDTLRRTIAYRRAELGG